MSLHIASWWRDFVSDLERRPLAALAARYRVSEAAALHALVASDPGGPAQEAPWWPEFLRARPNASLRALARQFGCEPRRLRRALAREGLRAGGRELGGRGDLALSAWRARLGTAPDAEIAREAGVAIEAVQGERRRLGVAPFSVSGPVRLTADEEAWIRGPEPLRRVRQRAPDASASLEVVRRPRSGADTVREPRRAEQTPGAALAPPPAPAAAACSPALPPAASPASLRRVSPSFFRTHERTDLDRLLQPVGAPRDGVNKRIVRVEPARPAPEAPPTAQVHPAARRPLEAPAPPVTPTRAFVPPPAPVRAAPPPAPVRAAPPPAPVRAAPPPAPVRAAPAPTPAPRPAPSAAPAAAPIGLAAPRQRWQVHIPGEAAPLVVEADSAWSAARAASALLPTHLWAQVSLVQAGADAGALLAWREVPTFG